jgi:hypothetical protein
MRSQPRRRSASPGRAGRGRHRRPTAIIGTASANATGWRNRKFADSPLEEGVYCELVSESEISEVSIPVRFWAILVS